MGISPKPREVIVEQVGGAPVPLNGFDPPPLQPAKPRTVMLWIHGGGWTSGKPEQLYPHCRYFVSRGVLAISLGYRLARAEGMVTAYDCLRDCRSALSYLRTHAAELGLNPAQIVVLGDSSGGHLAAGLGSLAASAARGIGPVRPDALVLFNPVLDLTAVSWLKDVPGFPAPGAGAEATSRLKAFSPSHSITPGMPPTLILHGTADQVLPLDQSVRYTQKMLAAGNPCRLVQLEATGHAFVIPGYGKPVEIVRSLLESDRFLQSLGWLAGHPTLAEPSK